jgi:hypothetical protein
MDLTTRLGVPWLVSKLRVLASIQRYIGLDWNLVTHTVAMPPKKLQATLKLAASWLVGDRKSKADAARLHGKLVHLATMYPLIQPFLRSVSQFAAGFKSSHATLTAPTSVCSDIKWITKMVHLLPSVLPLSLPDPVDIGWWGNASTSFRVRVVVGAYWGVWALGAYWGVWAWAPDTLVGPGKTYDIGWAEAVAIEIGLLMALEHNPLPHTSSNPVLVRSDNAGVVAVINKGRSRSRTTNNVLRRVYHTLASNGRSLVAKHIAGVLNISDPLSQGNIAGFLRLFPAAHTHTSTPLPMQLRPLLHPFG